MLNANANANFWILRSLLGSFFVCVGLISYLAWPYRKSVVTQEASICLSDSSGYRSFGVFSSRCSDLDSPPLAIVSDLTCVSLVSSDIRERDGRYVFLLSMRSSDRSSGIVRFSLSTSGKLYPSKWLISHDDVVVEAVEPIIVQSEPQILIPSPPPKPESNEDEVP